MRGTKKIITAVAAGALLAVPGATAQAQSPTAQAYSLPGGTVQDQIVRPVANVSPGTTSSPGTKVAPAVQQVAKVAAAKPAKTLPFTGLELGVTLAIGAMLLGTGLVVRRISRPPTS